MDAALLYIYIATISKMDTGCVNSRSRTLLYSLLVIILSKGTIEKGACTYDVRTEGEGASEICPRLREVTCSLSY